MELPSPFGERDATASPESAWTGGPPRPAPAAAVDRLRRYTWWSSVGFVYAAGAFVAVAVFATEPFGPAPVVVAVGAACGSIASALLIERRLARGPAGQEVGGSGLPARLAVIAVAGAVIAVIAKQWVGYGPVWRSIVLVPGVVTGGIAVSVSRRLRVPAVLVGALAAAGVGAVADYVAPGAVDLAGTVAVEGVLVALFGGAFISALWSWEVVERLDRARRLEGELAVADERLRFAADLHDIQGHHLQVIARYSELAARLAEADPQAAGAHMQQVHEHALTALSDTRAVVQGYRRASLGAELANATRVLAAAGIDGRLDPGTEGAADGVPEAGRGLLGLVVREATTNVLRHSRAERTRLALEEMAEGWVQLRIRNDGVSAATGETVATSPATTVTGQEPGAGLATLARRLDAAGGGLEWGLDGHWFTLTARVPLDGERGA